MDNLANTPGVYVQEISTLPPSVAQVSTAVPAFIGYTPNGKADSVEIAQVSSLLEYEKRFGTATATKFELNTSDSAAPAPALPGNALWYALSLYFKNGGGRCYVVSVGKEGSDLKGDRFEAGLTALEREDEPTLIVMPQAVQLSGGDFASVCQQALRHCRKMQDRFAILDVRMSGYAKDKAAENGVKDALGKLARLAELATTAVGTADDVVTPVADLAVSPETDTPDKALAALDTFDKTLGGVVNLAKVAATSAAEVTAAVTEASNSVDFVKTAIEADIANLSGAKESAGKLKQAANDTVAQLAPVTQATAAARTAATAAVADKKAKKDMDAAIDDLEKAVAALKKANPAVAAKSKADEIQTAAQRCKKAADDAVSSLSSALSVAARDLDIEQARTAYAVDEATLAYGAAYYPYLSTTLTHIVDEKNTTVGGKSLKSLQATNTLEYNQAIKKLQAVRVLLPPSAAIAGVYASVDRDRGVWKAPANVALQAVIGPTLQVTDAEQGDLNVHALSGKSINVIRAFPSRGSLVWGARTLAGNSNEWRYVPVRRLFITIEESAKKATAFAVFEPNDATTWLKVKGMLESYLYGLWEQGALQGAKPEAAFVVNVGLGKTMSQDDINNGILNVDIGVAAVRPAEFIYLRFSHKLAEA
jgi:phage tail sheath protein FI